jgi:hypothetical protein
MKIFFVTLFVLSAGMSIARESRAADIKDIINAQQEYYKKNGKYAPDYKALGIPENENYILTHEFALSKKPREDKSSIGSEIRTYDKFNYDGSVECLETGHETDFLVDDSDSICITKRGALYYERVFDYEIGGKRLYSWSYAYPKNALELIAKDDLEGLKKAGEDDREYAKNSVEKEIVDAVINNNVEELKKLLAKKTDFSYSYHYFRLYDRGLPMYIAAGKGYWDIIKLLIEKGVATPDAYVLRLTIQNNNAEILEYLLKHGGDKFVDEQDDDEMGYSFNMLEHAANKKSLPMVKLLIENGAHIDWGSFNALCISFGEADIFNYLLEKGANVNGICQCCKPFGGKILDAAVQRKADLKTIETLVSRGAKLSESRKKELLENAEPQVREYLIRQEAVKN